jgi:murein DD-endopeptidase MepM/ murein hydrolase activator NlpD
MAGLTSYKNTGDVDSPRKGKFALLIAASLCAFFLFAADSLADIYRFVDENGMECFTDTPAKHGAVRIMKEEKGSRQMVSTLKKHRPQLTTYKGKTGPTRSARPENGLLSAAILPVHGPISSNVGLRYDPIDGLLRNHNGVDIAVPAGTPVKPVLPGVVSYSGFRSGYGNEVIVVHDDGMITLYAHNSTNLVKEGESVSAGSTIALSGTTGRSTGPHLHFEAWKNGLNLTTVFVGQMSGSDVTLPGLHRHEERIRSSILADGSILFTNLPQ